MGGGGVGRRYGGRRGGGYGELLLHLLLCVLLLVGAALGDPRAAASPDSPHQSVQVRIHGDPCHLLEIRDR